jgi:hypothetical protein
MVPCQNTGTESPRRVPIRVAWSTARSRCTADRMPAPTPRTREKATARSVSSIVTGSRSRISESTGFPVRQEVPRLPWRSWPSQRRYWTYHAWSRPKKRLSCSTICWLTTASAPIICSTTVPGIRRSMRKTRTVSPRRVTAIE